MAMVNAIGALLVIVLGLAGWSAFVARKVEEKVRADGKCLDVAGARLHYVDLGPEAPEGPAIVMVHGLMGQLRNFSHSLAPLLAETHRVILVDRPGWGYSRLEGPRPGVAAQAAMLAQMIETLKLDRPLVVGHSFGGAVALALALDYPERVRGIALIAPFTRPMRTPPSVFRALAVPGMLRGVVAWTLAVPLAVRGNRAKTRAVFAPEPVPGDFPIRGGGALALRPASYLAGSFELTTTGAEVAALTQRYGEIGMPVTILYGRDDAILDPERQGAKTAAAIPGARFDLIEGGHMLPITQPGRVADWLRALAV
jgi:pimeloyl-ACP methyl ester carboxylesterase